MRYPDFVLDEAFTREVRARIAPLDLDAKRDPRLDVLVAMYMPTQAVIAAMAAQINKDVDTAILFGVNDPTLKPLDPFWWIKVL